MHGLFFYLQVIFTVVILLATWAALYMGAFKGHKSGISLPAKAFRGMLSAVLAGASWFGLYSWSYLSW